MSSQFGPRCHRANLADDIQTIISMIPGSKFIREVSVVHGSQPCVTLYYDRQILDLRKLRADGHIIGIDRTFNLGPVYITIMVYKHTKVYFTLLYFTVSSG